MIAFELLTPIVLFVYPWKKIQYSIVAFFYAFHVAIFAALTISFLPHLFAMACFLPLERVDPKDLARRARAKLKGRKGTPPQRDRGETDPELTTAG